MILKRSFKKFEARLAESGLRRDVEKATLKKFVPLKDLYEGPHTPSVVDARRVVYGQLKAKGKSVNEIARLFDRAPTGVLKLLGAS